MDSTQAQKWRWLEMPKITDVRGNLSVIEGGQHVPFKIERVYYIYDVPSGSVRAGHAHKALWQLFLALSGSFTLHLDDGLNREALTLNRPHKGLLVEPGVWRVIDNFSGGGVCMVLASMPYDEADYLRSYEEFEGYAKEMNGVP